MLISIQHTIDLLKTLIQTKSFSREEFETADILEKYLIAQGGLHVEKIGNNIICKTTSNADHHKPTIVLNSHHDTVKVSEAWTKNPFGADQTGDIIYGLGSNDAGASLVSLIHCFLHYSKHENLPFNLVLIASAEEEISGKNGLEKVLREIDFTPDLAIVGEPTDCQMAVAEKGLIVIDGKASGKAGHAANQIGDNAIYNAMKDIQWMEAHQFEKRSKWLGPVKLSVTQIEAGYQHNVIPDTCSFVVDCRINDQYTFEEIISLMKEHCSSELVPRSLRLKPSSIPTTHPIIKRGKSLGLSTFGSNTMSDQAFFNCPSVKIGPGDTNRSHKADEFIKVSEIKQGIDTYI